MRIFILLASATTLAACGGAGPQSLGSVAPPPAAAPGGSTPTSAHTFINPTEAKTYEGIGGVQSYAYNTRSDRSGQSGQLYAGDANTARDSGISVNYDPRDAIFNVSINRSAGGVNSGSLRFQDPVHRTAFGGAREPQIGVPLPSGVAGIQYLQAGSGSGDAAYVPGYRPQGANGFSSQAHTIFYQKPGTTTQYVTLGGYVYAGYTTNKVTEALFDPVTGEDSTNEYLLNTYSLNNAVYAYGERTDIEAVPKTGVGTYRGDMLATMVYNVLLDTVRTAPTYFQWITGTNTTTVDFGTLGVTTTLSGIVQAPPLDAYTNGLYAIPSGSTFTASGKATIDPISKGGFSGQITEAGFKAPNGEAFVVSIAGSSFDGAFFGPKGQEIGGGFRIVGGNPDERIDILGALTGKQ